MLHMTAQVVWPEDEREREMKQQQSGQHSQNQASPAHFSTVGSIKVFLFSIPCVCTNVQAYGRALFALIMRGGCRGRPSLSQWQLILHDQSGMN